MVFYRSFYEAIKELPLDVQSKVYSAIFEYSLNFNEVVLKGLPKTIFTLIKPQLDANNKRFENGKKGGRKKADNDQEETKTKPKQNQTETKIKPNNNVNDNVNNNGNFLLEKETKEGINFFENLSNWEDVELVKPEKEEKEKKVALKKENFIPPTVQQVQDYCNERQNGIQANTFVNFYQSKGWFIGKNKMKDWKAAVRTWEQKNKENGITNSTPQFSNTRAFTADKVSGRGNLNSPTIRQEFT